MAPPVSASVCLASTWRLVRGRHLARVQHAEHLLPPIGALDRVDRRRQRVEPETTLGVVGTVALEARGSQGREVRLGEAGTACWCGMAARGRERHGPRDESRPYGANHEAPAARSSLTMPVLSPCNPTRMPVPWRSVSHTLQSGVFFGSTMCCPRATPAPRPAITVGQLSR